MGALLQCKTCRLPGLVEGTGQIFTNNKEELSIAPHYNYRYIDYDLDDEHLDLFNPAKTLESISLKTIYPINATVAMPSQDMPDDVAADYLEARTIFEASPRSSAALLRLAIQKLCKHLGQTGKISMTISVL